MTINDKMLEVIKKIAEAKKDMKKACNQIAAYEYEQNINKLTDELVDLYADNITLYQKALKEMKELEKVEGDLENSHKEADNILKNIVKHLGYIELADSYDNVGKWYA